MGEARIKPHKIYFFVDYRPLRLAQSEGIETHILTLMRDRKYIPIRKIPMLNDPTFESEIA